MWCARKAFIHYDKLNNLQAVHLPWGRFFISMASWVMYVKIFSNLSSSLSLCFSGFHLRISPASLNSMQYKDTFLPTDRLDDRKICIQTYFHFSKNEAQHSKIYFCQNSNLPIILELVPGDRGFFQNIMFLIRHPFRLKDSKEYK